ncbi:sensor histidine kinase [Rubrivirga sp.]|uniref:sensor histidine kinase n=1 Tax=Rubrivirga sp. TaxID=1885344 RepID=UPI003B51FA86
MSPRLYWTCQLSGWGLYAAVNLALAVAYGGFSETALAFSVGASALGLGATHALRAVIRRRGWLTLGVGPAAVRLTAASVVAACAMAAVAEGGVRLAAALGWAEAPASVLLGAAVNWSFLVLLWSLVYGGVHGVRRWQRAERERAHADAERWRFQALAREAELRALQAQVNPHFLFNSLNTVRALVGEDPDAARRAVTELADLLRYALASGRRPTVPLADEVEAVRRYLALEALRFEDRLDARVSVDPDALAARVPPMVIQTLVENGIKHGIGQTAEGGVLRVEARAEAGVVRVVVESPGRLDPDAEPESGLGLANATERLRRLCGEHAALVVRQSDPATVRAEVLVPVGAVAPVEP